MLRIMVPRGHASLFIAEFAGEPLSAALLIAFGGMVSYKRGGWSGEQGNLHPNELLHWTAIRWAKREGYRYYDFEGVDLPAHVPGAHLDPAASRVRSVSAFKTGFGGDLVLLPQAYELVDNPVLRRGYDWVGPRLMASPHARRVVNAIRTR
jgi:lipid II:glycine glycyltransferase (peptidoglycan interpeptide bridge formation enzyme)